MKSRNLLLALAAVTLFTGAVRAATEIDEKLSLERSLQEKTERLVEKITGNKDMVVLVSVDLGENPAAAAAKQPKGSPAYPGSKMSEEEYLPGITYSYVPNDNYSPVTSGLVVKKISILITLDQNVPDPLIERLKTEVNSILGLNQLRGDAVNVQKILFARASLSWKDYIAQSSSQIYWLITMFLIGLFLFGPMRSFLKTIIKAVEIRIDAETRIKSAEQIGLTGDRGALGGGPSSGPLLPGGPDIGSRPHSPGQSSELPGSSKRFGFISADNLKNLIYLLKKEPPEKIAVVISYLPTPLASQLLASLTPQAQSQVAINISQTRLFDASVVEAIEFDIKGKIDYLLGGEEYFLNLLDQVDKETQENILNTVERENPALAERLTRALFFFDDVVILDKAALQRLIREAQRRNLSFAIALKSSGEDIKSKVLECLTEGAQAMLAEQIDLLGEIPDKRIAEEQRLISNLARELEKAGEIAIDRTKKFTSGSTSDTTSTPV